jgi:hypothetical protein
MEEMISQEGIARTKLERKKVRNNAFGQFHKKVYRKIPDMKFLLLFASVIVLIFVISVSCFPFQFNSVRAETGSGTDIFKVIVTIMGADKDSTGDVVPVVTVNDHSRVKLFNVYDNSTAIATTSSSNQNKIIEYVATFPNVTVNAGDEYRTCVLPLKTLKLICVEGTNSPGKRPEIVDLNLNSTAQNSQALTLSTQRVLIPYSSEDDQSSTSKNDKGNKDDKGDK